MDTLEEQTAVKMRQRLWGAAVLIALAVIFLPLLLDGAGSESQYRRVESLREEPPRVVRSDGQLEAALPGPVPVATAKTEIYAEPVENTPSAVAISPAAVSALSAWVVQAGSFGDKQNAIAVRDRLRRAGHPSFINATDDLSLYRVRVGPMTNQNQANRTRDDVMQLLGREALVTPYP